MAMSPSYAGFHIFCSFFWRWFKGGSCDPARIQALYQWPLVECDLVDQASIDRSFQSAGVWMMMMMMMPCIVTFPVHRSRSDRGESLYRVLQHVAPDS